MFFSRFFSFPISYPKAINVMSDLLSVSNIFTCASLTMKRYLIKKQTKPFARPGLQRRVGAIKKTNNMKTW